VTAFLTPPSFNIDVFGNNGRSIATIKEDGLARIFPGYHFDGATCAPDFPKAMRGVVFHDLLCQLLTLPTFSRLLPITRKDADADARALWHEDKFELGGLYYSATRLFGGLHSVLTNGIVDYKSGISITLY
jgi:hypothetical protein